MNGALFGGQTSGGNDNEKRKKIFVILSGTSLSVLMLKKLIHSTRCGLKLSMICIMPYPAAAVKILHSQKPYTPAGGYKFEK